jgi:hypothetical protein
MSETPKKSMAPRQEWSTDEHCKLVFLSHLRSPMELLELILIEKRSK